MISVLMGVYNAEKTLKVAIESIINQTYSDWELIICDDGSSDSSISIAYESARSDRRITVIRNNSNKGLGYALNRCFENAKGEYIARMDADDESLPERFATEVDFLNKHQEFDIVSSAITFFNSHGDMRTTRPYEQPQPIDLIIGSPIAHPACMMRRTSFENVCGYNEDVKTLRVEDIDLWIRMYEKGYRCYNLPISLYRYRFDRNAIKRQRLKYRINGLRVRWHGCRVFNLPIKYYFASTKIVIIGLIPASIRYMIHKKRNSIVSCEKEIQ